MRNLFMPHVRHGGSACHACSFFKPCYSAKQNSVDQAQLLKGVLELAVLAVIARGETYGYEILSTLESAGFDGVGDASVYGTLRRWSRRAISSPTRGLRQRAGAEVLRDHAERCRAAAAGTDAWSRISTALRELVEP